MEELTSMGIISIIPAILAIALSFATKNTIVPLLPPASPARPWSVSMRDRDW